jgi:hypothetical protein
MARRSSLIVGLLVVVITALALGGGLPLNNLLTEFEPIQPRF